MSEQRHLELVAPESAASVEAISPELALVDPDLAAHARSRLELPQPPPRPPTSVKLLPVVAPPVPVESSREVAEPELSPAADEPSSTASLVDPITDTQTTLGDAPESTTTEERAPSDQSDVLEDLTSSVGLVPRAVPTATPAAEPTVQLPSAPPSPPSPAPPVEAVAAPPPDPAPVEVDPAPPETRTEPMPVASHVELPRRRRRRLRRGLGLLVLGVVLGLVGGVVAADVWMPERPVLSAFEPTVPPVSTPEKTRSDADQDVGAGDVRQDRAARKPATPVTSPTFVWVAVPKTSRYEILFERGGRIVYRATTRATRLELPRSWQFQGKTHRLQRGRYHWTVWPLVDGRRGKPVVSSDYFA